MKTSADDYLLKYAISQNFTYLVSLCKIYLHESDVVAFETDLMPAILLTNIFAFVKVVDQFELKILANLVNILNREDSYVGGSRE